MSGFVCVVTGHRPTRFKFKYNENYAGCKRLKKRMQEQFIFLYARGVRQFWTGGALGADMWAAEILLKMKEKLEYSDIELFLALPFEDYAAGWDDWHRKRLEFIRRHSSKVFILGREVDRENYKKRNYYMVDQAQFLVAVYDNDGRTRSGTQQAVDYARKKNLKIVLIHPDTAQVTMERFPQQPV